MLHRIVGAIALATFIAVPLGAADDKKDTKSQDTTKSLKDAPEPEVKSSSKGKWIPVGDLVGTLKQADGNSLTLHVQYQEIQPDVGAQVRDAKISANLQRQLASLQRQLIAAQKIKNPAQRAARIQRILASAEARSAMAAAGAAAPFKIINKQKDIDVSLAQEVVVRVKDPPAEFDDKGEVKKYTAEELKKLKGPGNYWGYPADLDAVGMGQMVRVFVYVQQKPQNKGKPTTTTPSPGASSSKDKNSDARPDDNADEEGALVKVIYILNDNNNLPKKPGKGK
jgi:hypothetical protein